MKDSNCCRRARSRLTLAGFTLVELLLVVAIMGILAAVTLPNLARSMRGNRIRVATRSIISACRYARNISILRDNEHVLVFDIDRGAIYVSVEIEKSSADTAAEAAVPENPAVQGETGSNVVFFAERAYSGKHEIIKQLDGVVVESVDLYEEEKYVKGSAPVVFESNGRCDPFEVRLSDDAGKIVVITVDALACIETKEVF